MTKVLERTFVWRQGFIRGFLVAQLVKNTPVMLGRSPGEGKGYPFQYSGLENSMAVKSMGSQSWTRLSGFNSNTLATSCEELTHWKRP